MKNLNELVIEAIENLSSTEIKELNNAYCEANSYHDDLIYDNDDEFFEMNFSDTMSAVRAVSYGGYNYGHKYVQINGQGNLDSFSELDEDNLSNSVSTVAEWAIENQHQLDMFDWDELNESEEEETEDED